jgi:hypothetical protein
MSLLTLPLHKAGYLQQALADFLGQPPLPSASPGAAQLEGEYLVRELLDALELHVSALEALHAAAADMPAAEWAEHDTRLDRALRSVLGQAKALVAREDLRLKDVDRLRERLHEVEYGVLWSVADSAETPAFRIMVEESQRAYAGGEWEEGGWEFIGTHGEFDQRY